MDSGEMAFDPRKLKSMYITATLLALEPAFLAIVLWIMGRGGWARGADGLPPFAVALFAALALGSLPLGIWLRKNNMSGRGDFTVQKNRYSTKPITYTGAEAGMMRITGGVVAGMAMPTLPALFGFVLGFQFQDWLYFLPFAAYSVLGIIVLYPKPAQIRLWYAEQTAGLTEPQGADAPVAQWVDPNAGATAPRFTQLWVGSAILSLIPVIFGVVLAYSFAAQEPGTQSGIIEPWPLFFALAALPTVPLAVWLHYRQVGKLKAAGRPESANTHTTTDVGARITSIVINSLAIGTIPALLGFVVAYADGSWTYYLPFAAYSYLGIALLFPRPKQVRKLSAVQIATPSDSALVPPQPL